MLVKTNYLKCVFIIEVVQLILWVKLTEPCTFTGKPSTQLLQNVVTISWRGAISGNKKDDEYVVEACRIQARC